jgi:hypothetical protein
MSLNVQQTKIYGIPVPADKITAGELSIDSTVANLGDFVATGNISARTYTFDIGGISLSAAEDIQATCDANQEAMLLGQVNLTAGTGLTGGNTMYPYQYEETGGIRVGATEETLKSFPVTFVTNKYIGKLG